MRCEQLSLLHETFLDGLVLHRQRHVHSDHELEMGVSEESNSHLVSWTDKVFLLARGVSLVRIGRDGARRVSLRKLVPTSTQEHVAYHQLFMHMQVLRDSHHVPPTSFIPHGLFLYTEKSVALMDQMNE